MQNIKDQDLSQVADSLRNHSLELKDEVEKLDDELNNGKQHKYLHHLYLSGSRHQVKVGC